MEKNSSFTRRLPMQLNQSHGQLFVLCLDEIPFTVCKRFGNYKILQFYQHFM